MPRPVSRPIPSTVRLTIKRTHKLSQSKRDRNAGLPVSLRAYKCRMDLMLMGAASALIGGILFTLPKCTSL